MPYIYCQLTGHSKYIVFDFLLSFSLLAMHTRLWKRAAISTTLLLTVLTVRADSYDTCANLVNQTMLLSDGHPGWPPMTVAEYSTCFSCHSSSFTSMWCKNLIRLHRQMPLCVRYRGLGESGLLNIQRRCDIRGTCDDEAFDQHGRSLKFIHASAPYLCYIDSMYTKDQQKRRKLHISCQRHANLFSEVCFLQKCTVVHMKSDYVILSLQQSVRFLLQERLDALSEQQPDAMHLSGAETMVSGSLHRRLVTLPNPSASSTLSTPNL